MNLKLNTSWREWKCQFGAQLATVGVMALGRFAVATIGFAQDTVRVRSDAPPRWGAEVKLTPVWTIGQIDGPDELAFGMVGGVCG